jgi:hypothetical protein
MGIAEAPARYAEWFDGKRELVAAQQVTLQPGRHLRDQRELHRQGTGAPSHGRGVRQRWRRRPSARARAARRTAGRQRPPGSTETRKHTARLVFAGCGVLGLRVIGRGQLANRDRCRYREAAGAPGSASRDATLAAVASISTAYARRSAPDGERLVCVGAACGWSVAFEATCSTADATRKTVMRASRAGSLAPGGVLRADVHPSFRHRPEHQFVQPLSGQRTWMKSSTANLLW